MSGTPLLACDRLVAGYAGPVTGPVSLRLEAGEVVGLYGPNGAGKSTLLRAITGEARVFSGELTRVPGLTIAHHRQDPVRPDETPLTGRDVLRLTGADRTPAPRRLEPLLGSRLDLLSGGQFQLVQTWACLGSAAGLVLLDEPTRHLDREADALLEELIDRGRQGRAVLVISHEVGFLERCCDRVVQVGDADRSGHDTHCIVPHRSVRQ